MKQGQGWPIADPEYPLGYLGLHSHGLLEMPLVPSAGDNRKAAEAQPLSEGQLLSALTSGSHADPTQEG